MEKSKKIEVVIANGATRSWLDGVRFIANDSGGSTGAKIAELFIKLGRKVHYLTGVPWTKKPFDKFLVGDKKASNPDEEGKRIADAIRYYQEKIRPFLQEYETDDYDSFFNTLMELITNKDIKVGIMSVAGLDYLANAQDGKISSSLNKLIVEFRQARKMITEIKKIRRDIMLVGFKLLKDESLDRLIEIAYKNMLRDGQDLAVANIALSNRGFKGDFVTFILTLEKGIIPVQNRDDLPHILINTIENRYSENHFKTNLTKVDSLKVPEEEVDNFIQNLKSLSELALFDKYLVDGRAEFGFVAQRTDSGTLITSRASSKSEANISDLALITNVNNEEKTIDCESTEKKATLNGNVAHNILEARPEIKYVVHSHIHLPTAKIAKQETAPGTLEDWQAIEDLVRNGENVIYQPNHGVLILLENLDDIYEILEKNNIYQNNANCYDLAYQRFQESRQGRFVDIVNRHIPKNGKVLDMCAGTGELSLQLLNSGYKDINLSDGSSNMLNVAKRKITGITRNRFKQERLEDINYDNEFDGIVIRQAINYIAPDELCSIFTKLYNSLKSGGKLIFNTFLYDDSMPSGRYDRIETSDHVLLTHEGNQYRDGKVYHGQRTDIFDKRTNDHKRVYDLNSFYSYTKEQIENALRQSGFNVSIEQQGRSLYFVCNK